MGFLLRRLLHSVFLLVGASMLSFVLVDLAPGDFFDELRLNPHIPQAEVSALRARHGLNRSLPVQYAAWVKSIWRGDWGFSFAYNAPAGPILWPRVRNTVWLSSSATLLAWLIALPLGIRAASRPGSWVDHASGLAIPVLLATPELVLGLLCVLFAVRTGYLPAGGLSSVRAAGSGNSQFTIDAARHLLLPALCLTAGLLPILLSHVRSAMTEVLRSPYIAAARGYGIPPLRLLLRHALPAAASPLLSLFGLSIGMLVSSSLLIESLFGWPGLGQLTVQAILQRDFLLVLDATLFATIFIIAGNVLADILLYATDPRIRAN